MAARMVNAIPTANTNLAGFGFGAMFPSWLFCWYQVSVLVPDCRIFKEPIGEVYELLHSSPLVQKMMGRLTIRDTRPSLAPALLSGLFPYWPREKRRPSVARSGDLLPPSRRRVGHRQQRSGQEVMIRNGRRVKPSTKWVAQRFN
jgi:hypothetical protein